MAKSADESNVSADLTKSEKTMYSLRCRHCRTVLLCSDKLKLSHESSREGCGNCLYLDDDDLPSWIQNEVDSSGWTKGRIHCPKEGCPARVGGFDFVQGLLCSCGFLIIPAIWIQNGKVDVNAVSTAEQPSGPRREIMLADRSYFVSREEPDRQCSRMPISEKKHSVSLTGRQEIETESGTYPTEVTFPDSINSEDFGNTVITSNAVFTCTTVGPLATEIRTPILSTERGFLAKNKRASDNEFQSVETRRLSECARSTTLPRKRRLIGSSNRFGNLKVEEPEVISPPDPGMVDDQLTCAVCLDCFYKPHKCPCGHVFCEPCLRQLYHARSGTLKCPVCRSPVRYIEPASELREQLRKFHSLEMKIREAFEKTTKYKSWPLPPTGPLPFLKKVQPLVPSRDMRLIKLAGVLLLMVCCHILYMLA